MLLPSINISPMAQLTLPSILPFLKISTPLPSLLPSTALTSIHSSAHVLPRCRLLSGGCCGHSAPLCHTASATPYLPHLICHTAYAALHLPHRTCCTTSAALHLPFCICHIASATPYPPCRTTFATMHLPHRICRTASASGRLPHRIASLHLPPRYGERPPQNSFGNNISIS